MMDEDMLGTRDGVVFTVMFMYVCVGGDKGSNKDIRSLLKKLFSLGEKYDVCSNT